MPSSLHRRVAPWPLLLALLLAACAATTVDGTWTRPETAGRRIEGPVLVVGVARDETVRRIYEDDPRVRRVLDAFRTSLFAPFEPGIFSWLFEHVVENHDPYFHLADFDAYAAAQERVAEQWQDGAGWTRKAVLNVARMGKFSSDRTIREYARDIWKLSPVPPGDVAPS